ncbi:hypothetical protein CYMTET_7733 [Cymbomonas tetramitiformis]|uniref:Uncharacterized protein n=1 Tax=Cymbomonas tetramitiformis TaxID=36881 RepID=A0AAE0GV30_9CHLO|nr:hypothetical protein CYMTET_7733 [Cymbomonas tetramitiformis]
MDLSSTSHGGEDTLRAELSFMKDCICSAADGVVADEVLEQQWLNDFDRSHRKMVLFVYDIQQNQGFPAQVTWRMIGEEGG